MKKIRVKFVDVQQKRLLGSLGEEEDFNVFYDALARKYDVEISDNPEYTFCFCPVGDATGLEYAKYDCVRCQIAQENVRPDYNCFDYAVGLFHDFKFEDRYYYIPSSVYNTKITYDAFNMVLKKHENIDENSIKSKKFCSFVVSNGANSANEREAFFHLLNKYKKVNSGGRFLNNIGEPVKDKLLFEKEHKFSIAFENSWYSPISEKLDMAFAAQTVPIYWGNPKVGELYNEKAFINCSAYNSFNEVIERIKEIDNNDELFLSMLREPAFIKPVSSEEYVNGLADFFEGMIETKKEIAIQRSNIGWSRIMQDVRIGGFEKYIRRRKIKTIIFIIAGKLFAPWKNSTFANKVKIRITRK